MFKFTFKKKIKPPYRKSSRSIKPKRLKRNFFLEKRKKRKKIKLFLFFFFLFAVAIYLIFWSGFFKVKEVNIVRKENAYYHVSNKEIEEIASRILKKRRFLIFPQNNLLFFSKNLVKEEIEKRLPIEEIDIRRLLIKKEIKIVIKDKLPVLVLEMKNKFYYLDKEGKPIKSFDKRVENNLPLILFKSSLEEDKHKKKEEGRGEKEEDLKKKEIKKKILSPQISKERAKFIQQINKELPKSVSGLKAVSFIILDPDFSDLQVITSKNYSLYFDQEIPLKMQLDHLSLVINKKLKDKNLDYIDLRYKDRIYYRER